jgi:transcriptional regulator with XRE-family HTH domain
MDDTRLGLIVRALRRRLGWRQIDLARRSRVRQQEISNVERGRLAMVRLGTMRRITRELTGKVEFELTWRGGLADRLLDERHAALVERVATVLLAAGWQVLPEVSFGTGYGSGSIDLLAWHEASRTVLVIEVKTELTSIEETLRRFDVKVRNASETAARVLGWRPVTVSSLLVVAEGTTARRIVATHRATFDARFPSRGVALRRWLRNPTGRIAGLWFLPIAPAGGGTRGAGGSHRIRRPKSLPPEAVTR